MKYNVFLNKLEKEIVIRDNKLEKCVMAEKITIASQATGLILQC